MAEFSVKWDDRDAQRIMNKAIKGMKDFRPPLREVEKFQLKEIKKQFASQGEKITGKWKALKKNTVKQRIRMGFGTSPILKRTGKLKNSIKQLKLTKNILELGSKVFYFQFHQQGTSKIPQRQILGHSAQMKQKVFSLFQRYIASLIKK